MAKAVWQDTPFKTIAQAHSTAEAMELHPTAILENETHRYFQVFEKKQTVIVAQPLSGGSVKEKITRKTSLPKQDPDAPKFSDEDRMRVGPWVRVEDASLEEAQERFSRQFTDPGSVVWYNVVMTVIDEEEYQYYQAPSGNVYCRAMSK